MRLLRVHKEMFRKLHYVNANGNNADLDIKYTHERD